MAEAPGRLASKAGSLEDLEEGRRPTGIDDVMWSSGKEPATAPPDTGLFVPVSELNLELAPL